MKEVSVLERCCIREVSVLERCLHYPSFCIRKVFNKESISKIFLVVYCFWHAVCHKYNNIPTLSFKVCGLTLLRRARSFFTGELYTTWPLSISYAELAILFMYM